MNDHSNGALLAIWPDEAIDAIHLASMAVLERAGCAWNRPAARDLLLAAGCTAAQGQRVLVPRAVVRQALDACPASYTLAARDPRKSLAMDAEPAQTYVHNMGGARDVADARTGVSRRATVRDQARASRIMHHLVNQQQITSLWQPQDVPDLLEPLYSYLVLAFETDKAIGGPGISHPFQAHYLQQMAQAVTGADGAGGRYPVDLAFSPVSPLILGREVTDALIAQVRRGGVVVEILPCPAAATTAPGASPPPWPSRTPRCWPASCSRRRWSPGTPVYYGPRLSAVDPRRDAGATQKTDYRFALPLRPLSLLAHSIRSTSSTLPASRGSALPPRRRAGVPADGPCHVPNCRSSGLTPRPTCHSPRPTVPAAVSGP